MMPKILLGGYYGANNIGDEAILSAMLDTFRSLRADLEFTVVSNSPQFTETQHAVSAISWRDVPSIAQAVRRSDLVILGGGGLFMDYWGLDDDSYFRITHGGISTYGSLVLLANLFNVPCMISGVGVGPLKSQVAREHTRDIFTRANLATIRDEDSMALLKEIGLDPLPVHIHLTTDIAFALQSPPEFHEIARQHCARLGIDPQAPLLGVSVRFWDRPELPEQWIPPLAESIRQFLARSQGNVLLLPFQADPEGLATDDLQICRALAQAINQPDHTYVMEDILPVYEMQAILGHCDLILAMRLHALLMGMNDHVPVIGIAYDPKISAMMKQAGLEKLICPMPFTAQDISQKLSTAWQERVELKSKLQAYHQKMQELARENARLALDLLGPRQQPSAESLADFLVQRLGQMQKVDLALQEKSAQLQSMSEELNEAKSSAILLKQHLDEIESSRTYRLAMTFQNLRNFLLPPDSRRENWLRSLRYFFLKK